MTDRYKIRVGIHMKKTMNVEGYHRIGSHCLTTAISTVLRYQGLELTEEMVLGLGSGLGFTYVRQKDAFMFGGRGGNLEINLGSAFGLEVNIEQSKDADLAWEKAKDKLRLNLPQILDVDMSYLEYIKEKLHMEQGFSFSGHKVILIGYDEEKNVAYMLDYLWNRMVLVNVEDLKKARSSPIKPVSPNNTSITIFKPDKIYPMEFAIREAIDFNVQQMLYPVGYGLGLKALTRFFKEIKTWPEILTEDRLRWELNMAHMVFEKIGTGGGNFRRMYSRFLKSSAEILENNVLLEVSKIYAALGRLWKMYAGYLYEASICVAPKEADILNRKYQGEIELKILEMEYLGIQRLEQEFIKRR